MQGRGVHNGSALGKTTSHLVEARYVNRLAEALLIAAAEHAQDAGLSEGVILGAFAIALGRVTGSAAREGRQSVTLLMEHVGDQVRRVAWLEFGRRPGALQ